MKTLSLGSLDAVHDLNLIDLELAVGTDVGLVVLETLPAHNHVPAIEKNHVSTARVTNYAGLVLVRLIDHRAEVVAHHFLPLSLQRVEQRLDIAPQPPPDYDR
jgi:hypothetical protein